MGTYIHFTEEQKESASLINLHLLSPYDLQFANLPFNFTKKYIILQEIKFCDNYIFTKITVNML
ncbi:hypothetical protein CTER_1488 [Ruminiclostridium cellobioparum subsp. termitidis CT1112]|uniref:Uncharacterized protein n=1 Tax=Ruminiclostridium cellobioparum subsp. termitidis CT1112 TaxID=1195236 RepID=S0FKM3_RUMCE|nr:hypothetical protein CTER_1488 [Ruminiclostridium cellobioparum subsp. termitidis CT1112]